MLVEIRVSSAGVWMWRMIWQAQLVRNMQSVFYA